MNGHRQKRIEVMRIIICIWAAVILAACTQNPTWEPILISKDVCHYCKMVITDKRFGAEFVTQKGKIYKFDAVECMGHFLEDNKNLIGTAYVVDSFSESKLIEIKKAHFIHDPQIRSPMGKGILATESIDKLNEKNINKLPVLEWNEISKLIGRPELINL